MTDETTLIPKDYYVGIDGEEYQIYPMKLKDYAKVDRLFRKINETTLYLNAPSPMLDEQGNIVLNKDGKPKYDYVAYNAMLELFEMALRLPRKKIEQVVDVSNGVEILDTFRGVSGLKKKITEMMDQQEVALSTSLLQALYKIQAKQENL